MPTSDYENQKVVAARAAPQHNQFSRNLILRLARRSSAPNRILDIGCGGGVLLHQLSEIFPQAHLTGIDPSDALREKAKELLPGGTFISGISSNLPVPDSSCDMVVSTWALHHCRYPRKAMQEAARILEVGGTAIFCIFHPIHSFLHLHDKVHEHKLSTLDYWGSDSFINHLHYGIDVEEQHHTLDDFIGPEFLECFDLLHFSEGKQVTSPNVRNVSHPTFFLVKAKKRHATNSDAIVPLEPGESLKGEADIKPSTYPPIEPNPLPAIAADVSELIGNTPLVRVAMAELAAEVLLKLEYMNPMGSVKDRLIAAIDKAMSEGSLNPGDTVVEATAGNTGIAFMAALASRGLKGKILLMEKFSDAKANTLKLLGAEVIRVPNGENDQVAARAMAEREGAYHFGQFHNLLNPWIHETTTANELWEQCGGHIDVLVAGCGTGGTLMGLSRNLKKRNSGLKVVGVSPAGAKLLPEDEIGCWEIEGIGTPYAPPLCDVDLVDEWVRVQDKEAFQTAHRLMVKNSIFCGSSAGANMAGALRSEIVSGLTAAQRCVVILPDSSRNYPNTLSDYGWMQRKGYLYDS